jgi:pilus assembly protein Flp/PilA
MVRLLKKLLREETGAAAIEYGLLAALISVAIIIGVSLVGQNLNIVFMQIARELESARRRLPGI